jgi:hypothetical protein
VASAGLARHADAFVLKRSAAPLPPEALKQSSNIRAIDDTACIVQARRATVARPASRRHPHRFGAGPARAGTFPVHARTERGRTGVAARRKIDAREKAAPA